MFQKKQTHKNKTKPIVMFYKRINIEMFRTELNKLKTYPHFGLNSENPWLFFWKI